MVSVVDMMAGMIFFSFFASTTQHSNVQITNQFTNNILVKISGAVRSIQVLL